MSASNNGWPVAPALTRITVGDDANGATFAAGDVSEAFRWLFTEIHETVERVTMLNGARTVAENTAAGGAASSNHLSGTAGDVNGFRHPYEHACPPSGQGAGYVSGWSPNQVRIIRSILARAGGLFAWGMDYAPPWRDAMHFDIAKGRTPADVASFLATLTDPTSNPVEVPMFRLYHITDDGRVFLGGPGLWRVVPDPATLATLQVVYGPWLDVTIQVGQGLSDTFIGPQA